MIRRYHGTLVLACIIIPVAMGCSAGEPVAPSQLPPGPPASNRVTVTLAGNGTGRVTAPAPSAIDCPGTCSEFTGQITLSANADPGSSFNGWSGDCTVVAGSCQVSPSATNGDQRVTARFILSVPGGVVVWDGGGDGVNWTDPLNWDTDLVPTGNDDVTITAPGITVRHAADVTSFVKTLTSSATIEVAFGILEATNGATLQDLVVRLDHSIFQESGVLPKMRTGSTITVNGTLTVSAGTMVGGTLNANGPANFGALSEEAEFDGVTLTTSASSPTAVAWSVCLGNGSTWTIPAGGVVTLTNQFSCNNSVGLAPSGRLINRGTMQVAGVSIGTPFDNEGVVEVMLGGLELRREGNHSGSFIRSNPMFFTVITVSPPAPTPSVVENINFLAGSSIEVGQVVFESGQARVGGGYDVGGTTVQNGSAVHVTFQTGATVSDGIGLEVFSGQLLVESGLDLKFSMIQLIGGTLNVGHVTGNASVTTDQLSFNSGVLKGTGKTVITGGGSLTMFGDQVKEISDGHTIELFGSGGWGGTGMVQGGQGSLLDIRAGGTFGIVHPGDLTWDGTAVGVGSPMRILNNGVLEKIVGTGTTTMIVCYDNASTGTKSVLAGVLDIQDQCP